MNEGSELANYHTHGLQGTHGHPDLQVVLPLAPEIVNRIFAGVVSQIKQGKTYVDGMTAGEGIIQNGYQVKFITAREGDREVLHIIVPDIDNQVEEEQLEYPYTLQYQKLGVE